jgi:transposase
MKRFIEGEDRGQGTLLPELLDDYVAEDNPVRVVDVFVEELDIAGLGFKRVQPAKTGRPAYHPNKQGQLAPWLLASTTPRSSLRPIRCKASARCARLC